jgi:hypothetical protein
MTAQPITSRPHRIRLSLRSTVLWMLTFAGFPLGSVAARLVAGPIDGPLPALLGGLVNGLVIGGAQAWALGRTRPSPLAWVLATGLGLSIGLWLGAGAVDYGTDLGSLVVQGAISGLLVGVGQAAVLFRRIGPVAMAWPVFLAGAWALGWAITVAVGVEVDLHFTVFGSSGAITVTALTLVLPATLSRTSQEDQS